MSEVSFKSAPIKLIEPITGSTGPITHVVLRIPPADKLDANPIGIEQGRWNMAQILDLPLSSIFRLCAEDVEALGHEWEALMQRWNLMQVRSAGEAVIPGFRKA